MAAYGVRKTAALLTSSYFSILTSSWDVLELAIATERSIALVISLLVSLMMDQVCSLQAHGVCAAIRNSGNTWVSKALLATERDIAQGKLRFLFTAPGAIVGNSRWKQILLELSDIGMAVTVLYCVYKLMCPHTLSARPRTLTVNDYIIVRYFTAYYTENKRYLSRMRTQ